MGHGLTSLYHGYGWLHIIHVIAGGMLGTLGKGAGATGIRKAGTPGTQGIGGRCFQLFLWRCPCSTRCVTLFCCYFFCGVFKIFQIYSGIANSIAIEHDKSISPWQAIYKNGYVMICSIAMQDKLPGGSDAISYQISLGHSDPTWSNSHPRTVSR